MRERILDLPWTVYSRNEMMKRSGAYALAIFPGVCDGYRPVDDLTIAFGNPRDADCGIYPPAVGAGGVHIADLHEAFRLMAASREHAVVLALMASGVLKWEPFRIGDSRGSLVFTGVRHSTELDEFGCPVVPNSLRPQLPTS